MKLRFRKIILVFILTMPALIVKAQANSISIDSCYVWAKKNYPLIRQYELIAKSNEFTMENITKGYLPQININGQATYQSDVTQLPKGIPGVSVLSKDQYKIFAEANQVIFDGGIIRQQKQMQQANSLIAGQKLEVELYKLKDRVNQMYFGILLIDERLKQNTLMRNDIHLALEKVNAQVKNGTALQSNADILKAELLQTNQWEIELKSNRKSFTEMLGLLIDHHLDENTVFSKPENIFYSGEIKRPELMLFDYQRRVLDIQNNLLTAKNNPKLSFFLQGGYGRPAFNILSDKFDPFYIGGLRLSIPLSGFYTIKNERALLNINRENIEVQKNTFLFNTNLEARQQSNDITKYQALLKTDDEIIALRSNVKKTSLSQLENGVINSGDYLRDVNAENSARQNKILDEIHLLMAQYNERNISGE